MGGWVDKDQGWVGREESLDQGWMGGWVGEGCVYMSTK